MGELPEIERERLFEVVKIIKDTLIVDEVTQNLIKMSEDRLIENIKRKQRDDET
jgi:hypothetical protein